MENEWLYLAQLVINGISLGCIYALVGIGFVLIFKATNVLNFAQGEVFMISAYICYFLVVIVEINFFAATLITIAIAMLMGVVTEKLILRPLINEPVFSIVMVTVGLSLFLRSIAGITFGYENLVLPTPFSEEPINMGGGLVISETDIWLIAVTIVLIIGYFLFFKYSRLGLAMRGTADEQDVASLMGISVKRVFTLIWAMSFITAAIAGIALASVTVISLGLSVVAVAVFPAIVLGGMESIPGAIIGGFFIGIVENLVGGYLDQKIGGGLKDVTSFVVLFLALMIIPYGLFGKKEIERV